MKTKIVILLSCLWAGTAQAKRGDIELGGFAGTHIFSTHSELGVPDGPSEPSPEDGLGFGPRLGVSVWKHLNIEAELALVPTGTRGATKCGGSTSVQCPDLMVIEWRAHAIWHFTHGKSKWRPFALLGGGALTVSSSNPDVVHTDTDLSWEAGVGVKYALEKDLGLRADVRVMLPPSSAGKGVTVDYEAWFGVYATFGRPKPAPKKKEEDVAKDTAPAPVDPDPDHDGVIGAADKCPTEAGVAKAGGVTPDGCPEKDTDGDGVPDSVDQCPTKAAKTDDGCDHDSDGDGVYDSVDQCVAVAAHTDDGCPLKDRDNDGIADDSDKCPEVPETLNGWQDSDGCPDAVPADLMKVLGPVPVKWDKNDAIVGTRALDAIVDTVAKDKDAKLTVRGIDATAEAAASHAAAVKAYFVAKGIAADRLLESTATDAKTKGRVELELVITCH
jgi:hypothetical protein